MRKRLVIDWIRNIGKCHECGVEQLAGMGFQITNRRVDDWCNRCQKNTKFTITAHEVALLEEPTDKIWGYDSLP